ncbi:alpha/beta fold hydrolase [uncultured Roseovarius sp.]|uniref:alpha/beta hydrolase n=1 Tax=uncultured Roseovarius sp. TaxID=293344 RepID=UPI00261F13D0|nr:alpha/beta fold hydrolase [uncultured Roseovarius sp.]
MIFISLAILELARHDIEITRFNVGQTPVARYAVADAKGPAIVVAHGFAGSQQMMQGYALPLARAGYRVFVFEFLGHGRNSTPMSGDVSAVDGTTQLLMEQVADVMNAVAPESGPVALIGHSMATDILVRVAASRDDVGPLVLISAFSQQVDDRVPDDLLLVVGAWEPRLRRFAEDRLQMVDPEARAGDTATNGIVLRRYVVAPFAEHVSVLQSRTGRRETLTWLDRAYGRTSDITILSTGWAILGLLGGLVMLFRPICRLLPKREIPHQSLSLGQTALVLTIPMLVAPVIAVTLDVDVLPVLVADYLALHMLVFGGVQLVLLRMWRIPASSLAWPALGVLLLACALFGFALDRYAANFWPTAERFWIIVAMMIGTLPYMTADAILTANQTVFRRLWTRASFLASLGIAVALDFEGLFFLMLIAPVLFLFYVVFGAMGRDASNRSGPLSSGLALGMVLAWALGVSFPIFEA